MRKSSSYIMILAAAALMSSAACAGAGGGKLVASRDIATERVELSDVRSITVSDAVDVVYVQTASGSPYAELHAPANMIDHLVLAERGGNLDVGFDMPRGYSILETDGRDLYVKVYAPDVTTFRTASVGRIVLEQPLSSSHAVTFEAGSSGDIVAADVTCADLAITSHSAGDVSMRAVKCAKASIDLSSSGDCRVGSLDCTELSASTGSAGDIGIDKVKATSCSLDASSSGNIEVRRIEAVKVKASTSSAGDIAVSGSCTDADLSSKSAGNIDAGGLKAVNTVARALSAGEITCHASGSLDASASVAGSISCSGNPSQVTTRGDNISVK